MVAVAHILHKPVAWDDTVLHSTSLDHSGGFIGNSSIRAVSSFPEFTLFERRSHCNMPLSPSAPLYFYLVCIVTA